MKEYPLKDFKVRLKITADLAFSPRKYNWKSKVQISHPVVCPAVIVPAIEKLYWKPEYKVIVEKISVINPVQYVRVNNLNADKSFLCKLIRDKDLLRRRESTLSALKNVCYVVDVRYQNVSPSNKRIKDHLKIINSRIKRQSYKSDPDLGCLGYNCTIHQATGFEIPVSTNLEIKGMLSHYDYSNSNAAVLFDAVVKKGVMLAA